MNSIQQIFRILQQRASSNLTDDDLKAMAGATSFAKDMALEARDVFMGIGCLVNSDEGGTGSLSTHDDVPPPFSCGQHLRLDLQPCRNGRRCATHAEHAQ